MPEFVLCEHPDLPGQTARMAHPRNGWTPVAAPPVEPPSPSGGEVDPPLPPGGAPDSPSAGTSTTPQDEE